jgi:acetyl/propionyl-CoA carboxylase alpha subunit
MIAKLITYSPTRSLSSLAMSKALAKYRVVGLPTNLKFLKNVFDNQIFEKGDYDTSFI